MTVGDQVRAPILCLPVEQNFSELNMMLSGYLRRFGHFGEWKISCHFSRTEPRFLGRSAHSLLITPGENVEENKMIITD
jgi:hypothetical protein